MSGRTDDKHDLRGPTFQVIERRPPRPEAVVLACLIVIAILGGIGYAMQHEGRARVRSIAAMLSRGANSDRKDHPPDQEDADDDPSQVDVVYLGDAADAPKPMVRAARASTVHPTVIVKLPRFGPQTGLIPNTGGGHLFYRWLAAFNQADASALSASLPAPSAGVVAAQLELRQQTGGLQLVSAKEVGPGLLVFRVRDQTPSGTEALGTMRVLPDSDPPMVASFTLQAIP